MSSYFCRADNLAELQALFAQGGYRTRGRCLDDRFSLACATGDTAVVEFLMSKGANNWNAALVHASTYGRETIVDLLVSKGADDWNAGLRGACCGGNESIVRRMISNGADDWNYGLANSYYQTTKNVRIIELMLRNGATNAASVFELPRDLDLILELLSADNTKSQETVDNGWILVPSACRWRLAGIAGIDDVLARLDSVSAAVRALLAAIGFPAVLEDMIAAYCINC